MLLKTQFVNFETYIKKNGLTTHKSLFFIQLWRRWEAKKSIDPPTVV